MKYDPKGMLARAKVMGVSGFLFTITTLSFPFSVPAYTPCVLGFGVARLTCALLAPKLTPNLQRT
jgi:hypothetical protein